MRIEYKGYAVLRDGQPLDELKRWVPSISEARVYTQTLEEDTKKLHHFCEARVVIETQD